MLLVILGAGASYDSAPSRPPDQYKEMPNRPPLADHLFDDRKYFGEVMNKYPQCLPIIPLLRDIERGSSVEKVLQRLQTEAKDYPQGFRQLAAIKYYLQEILFHCPNEWLRETQSISNYLALVDHIKRGQKKGEQVCFVTFNYDTLLDRALEHFDERSFTDMASYVDSDLLLIKIHGSVNWGRVTTAPADISAKREDIARHFIEWYSPEYVTNQYVIIGEYPPGVRDRKPILPALAIPVESKLAFECPKLHLDALKSFLPKVTKILIIGWRATEEPFLNLLRDGVHLAEDVAVVNGDKAKSEEATTNLRRAKVRASHYYPFDGGFTSFFRQGIAANLFLYRS